MKYQKTALNITALVYLIGCSLFTAIRWNILSDGEGWGVVYMVALFGFGCTAFVADLILQFIFRKPKVKLVTSIVATIIYVVLFFL